MFRLRTFQKSDLDALISLAYQGDIGMTNLPKNPERLEEMGDLSCFSFQEKIEKPAPHFYIFVLEDVQNHQAVGISGIRGTTSSLEYFRVSPLSIPPLFEEVSQKSKILKKVKYTRGPSEVCSLFLSPAFREKHLGKLLSLSRFHFIAAFKERFTSKVFADMRGLIHPTGECPFWDGVGRHFLSVPFSELMEYRIQKKEMISSIMPPFPIYIDLLQDSAKKSIGQTHVCTAPALKMLLDLGFSLTHEVDLYDAGPRVISKTTSIKTIKESQTFIIKEIAKEPLPSLHLVSNESIHFKSVFGKIDPGARTIDKETAELLEVKVGSLIRYSP